MKLPNAATAGSAAPPGQALHPRIPAQQLDENALNIYTDGSCYSSPRVGGIGFLFIGVDADGNPEVVEESPPGWKSATNNQMELQACIEALRIATGKRPPFDMSRFTKIVLYSDSQYVTDNIARAMFEWPKAGWRTRSGGPVLNVGEWKELIKLIAKAQRELRQRVEIKWVKGHKKDQYNKRVDKLAKRSAKNPSAQPFRPQRVRRKLSPNPVEIGCVPMRGQITAIRISLTSIWRPRTDAIDTCTKSWKRRAPSSS